MKYSRQKNLFCFIAGFVDGEGSFSVAITKHSNMKFNWAVDPVFQVYQHKDNREILERIKEVFGCGTIRAKCGNSNVLVYSIDNRRSLMEKVIPFFSKYPLIAKQKDFLTFKRIVQSMDKKKHLTKKGLIEVINFAYSMNQQGKQRKYPKVHILESLK